MLHVNPAPSSFNPAVTPEIDRIAAKALAKETSERYQTAREMAADLEAALADLTRSGNDETQLLPAAPVSATAWDHGRKTLRTISGPLRRSGVKAAVAVVALALAIFGTWRLLPGGSYRPRRRLKRRAGMRKALPRCGTALITKPARPWSAPPATIVSRWRTPASPRRGWSWITRTKLARKCCAPRLPEPVRGSPITISFTWRPMNLTLTGDFTGAAAKHRQIVDGTPDAAKAYAYVDLGRAVTKNRRS